MGDKTYSVTALTKRQIHEQLLERYKASLLGNGNRSSEPFCVTVWQETPSDPNMLLPKKDDNWIPCDAKRTAAKVVMTWRGIPFADVGFATLNTRCGDTWDSAYGIMMAVKKAIAGIARQIALGKPASLIKTWDPHHRHIFSVDLVPTEPQTEERSQSG